MDTCQESKGEQKDRKHKFADIKPIAKQCAPKQQYNIRVTKNMISTTRKTQVIH